MPLAVDNNLPSISLRFGTNDDDEINFRYHLDSCAAMNTGNMLLHMWLMTKYPQAVVSFERCDDPNAFVPLALDTAIPSADKALLVNQLSAVVVYRTRYLLPDGKHATIAFGLGESISVNAIVGIPTWKSWGLTLDLVNNIASSAALHLSFPISFTNASTGLPPGIQFTSADFVRPSPVLPPKPSSSTPSPPTVAQTPTNEASLQNTADNHAIFQPYPL